MDALKIKNCFGVHIGAYEISGVLTERNGKDIKQVKSFVVNSDKNLLDMEDQTVLKIALNQLFNEFNKTFEGQYIPVQVSLADPLIKSSVFELDVMPNKGKAKEQLIRWRFERECHVKMDNMSITYQPMISNKGAQQIYSLTTTTDVVRIIEETCKKNNLMLNSVDASVNYLFNRYYDYLENDASLVQMNQDYWTLLSWDGDKQIHYVRSKWFRSSTDDRYDEIKSVLLEVERLLHSLPDMNVNRIRKFYIETTAYDQSRLEDFLENRKVNDYTFLNSIANIEKHTIDDQYMRAALAARLR